MLKIEVDTASDGNVELTFEDSATRNTVNALISRYDLEELHEEIGRILEGDLPAASFEFEDKFEL